MQPTGPERNRATLFIAVAALAAVLLATTGTARAAWEQIARILSLHGKPEPASANVLSDHHLAALDSMTPQAQAEFLLERAINHYDGANRQIETRLAAWRGHIEPGGQFESLFRMAINSDDLRVRAAAIEIDILARKLEKNTETVDRLEPIARSGEQGARANACGISVSSADAASNRRVATIILSSAHDDNVNIRYWAVEGLAYLATDEVIDPLLDIFHDDPSPMIRERAACSLAQSGMLNREQRMRAVPRLLDFAGDGALDEQTRDWVFQALRDISGETLPREAAAWRGWYAHLR